MSTDRCKYIFKRGDKKGCECGAKGNPMGSDCVYKYLCKSHERQVMKVIKGEAIETKNRIVSTALSGVDDSDDYWDEHIWIPPRAPVGCSDDVFWCPSEIIY